MSNVLFGGLHRGASAIVKELKDDTTRLYEPDWLLADPKANRAAQMAGVLRDRFATLNPQPLTMRVQDALFYSREHDTVVLALDTSADTAETLAARRRLRGCPRRQAAGCFADLTPSPRQSFSLCVRWPVD